MIFPIISVGIFLTLILIFVPAMIILCLCLQTPSGRKMLPITCLHKSILIPKRFIGKGIIERNRPWKSPTGIEVVTLHIQFTVILESMIKGSFALPGIDAGVVTFLFRHVFSIDQRERVITVRPHISGIYRHACTAAQFLPPAQRGADHAERPSAHPCLKSGIAPVIKMRFFRLYAQHTGRRIQAGGLQQVLRLPDGERKHGNIVQRKTPDIYLPRLTIAHRHPVITDSCMGCSHIAYGNRFQSSNTSIVLYIGSGKTAHSICHILYSQLADILP